MRLLYVHGQAVSVEDSVYKAFWQEHEHAKYLNKKQRAQEISREALQSMGAVKLSGECRSAEKVYFANERMTALYTSLAALGQDGEDFAALTLGETTERAIAARDGCSPSTVHRRKVKTMHNLRQLLHKVT